MSTQCPCGKNDRFESCCGRFLSGDAVAKTPEQLMRSRYTAYALGGYGEYLLKTWFPATARDLNAIDLSQRSVDYCRLEVLKKSQQGDQGTVEFKAWYRSEEGSELQSLHEVSEFTRVAGRWFYVGGIVHER